MLILFKYYINADINKYTVILQRREGTTTTLKGNLNYSFTNTNYEARKPKVEKLQL